MNQLTTIIAGIGGITLGLVGASVISSNARERSLRSALGRVNIESPQGAYTIEYAVGTDDLIDNQYSIGLQFKQADDRDKWRASLDERSNRALISKEQIQIQTRARGSAQCDVWIRQWTQK